MAKRFLSAIKLTNLNFDPGSGSEGELYFNNSSKNVRIYSDSSWKNLVNVRVDYGPSYPDSPIDGDLFFNFVENRLAIFYQNVWREFTFVPEVLGADGGSSSTVSFGTIIDGGNSQEPDYYINIYDGGDSAGNNFQVGIDAGSSSTTVFDPIYDGGFSNTIEFDLLLDAGNS